MFVMFLINKIISFDPSSVPKVFKRGWEIEHFGGRVTLEEFQATSKQWLWYWWRVYFVTIAVTVALFASGGPLADHPDFSFGWWMIIFILIAVVSIIWWIPNLYIMPPISIKLMKEFIDEYPKLAHLLNDEWKLQLDYPPENSPNSSGYFKIVVGLVGGKLIELASRIKALEKPEASSYDRLKSERLRKEFGRAFDILKPFGLVYPDHEPYFNPGSSHFYG